MLGIDYGVSCEVSVVVRKCLGERFEIIMIFAMYLLVRSLERIWEGGSEQRDWRLVIELVVNAPVTDFIRCPVAELKIL